MFPPSLTWFTFTVLVFLHTFSWFCSTFSILLRHLNYDHIKMTLQAVFIRRIFPLPVIYISDLRLTTAQLLSSINYQQIRRNTFTFLKISILQFCVTPLNIIDIDGSWCIDEQNKSTKENIKRNTRRKKTDRKAKEVNW